MNYITITIFLFVFSISTHAQVFPTLNASTGNEGQYITDTDTNTITFHRNRIEKFDKAFNPIYIRAYSGLEFYSLLLSKTGSIYFIAKDSIYYPSQTTQYNKYVGKINNSGAIEWMKTIEHPSFQYFSVRQLLLDRNSDLMLSGDEDNSLNSSSTLIKLDTAGNLIYSRGFSHIYNFHISNTTLLNDSLGHYKCIYSLHGFESDNIGLFMYSEPGDSIFSQSTSLEYPQFYYITSANYYKSKMDSNVYYSITDHAYQGGSSLKYTTVRKYNKNTIVWNKRFNSFYGPYFINSFDEDERKNVIFTISPKNDPNAYHTYFKNYCFKLDSNGGFSGSYATLLSYSWWPPSSQYESAKLHAINNNKYLYDIVGANFPFSPLSVTFLDSSLFTNCATSAAMTMTNVGSGYMWEEQKSIIVTYPGVDVISNSIPATIAISDFTTNANYCLSVGIEEPDKQNDDLSVYPNPAHNKMTINSVNHDPGITSITVFDVSGRQVSVMWDGEKTMDVSAVKPGMYFMKIKTSRGEYSRKFIKE